MHCYITIHQSVKQTDPFKMKHPKYNEPVFDRMVGSRSQRTKYFWKKNLETHLITFLLAPFASKLVNNSRRSDSLKVTWGSTFWRFQSKSKWSSIFFGSSKKKWCVSQKLNILLFSKRSVFKSIKQQTNKLCHMQTMRKIVILERFLLVNRCKRQYLPRFATPDKNDKDQK